MMLSFSILWWCTFLLRLGVAQYQWACNEPDDNGRRYIPSVRDRDVLISTTDGAQLKVYHVGNLTENCHGEVTAIEYCYQYDNSGEGEAVFNWTVLILELQGSGNFRITNLHIIESRPNSLNAENCVNVSGGRPRRRCCDTKSVNGFNLPVNFVFGVTGSTQGNTHGVTLLRFADALPQYRVNTVQLNRDAVTLSIGSAVPSTPVAMGGLSMLWFVTGLQLNETSTISAVTTQPMFTTNKSTSPTVIPNHVGMTTMGSVELTESTLTPSELGYAVGVAVGGLLMVFEAVAVIVFTVLVVKRRQAYKISEEKTTQENLEAMEVEDNAAYISTTHNMLTEDTIAYYGEVRTQISTEDSVLYDRSTSGDQILTNDNTAYVSTHFQVPFVTDDDPAYVITEVNDSKSTSGPNADAQDLYDYVHWH